MFHSRGRQRKALRSGKVKKRKPKTYHDNTAPKDGEREIISPSHGRGIGASTSPVEDGTPSVQITTLGGETTASPTVNKTLSTPGETTLRTGRNDSAASVLDPLLLLETTTKTPGGAALTTSTTTTLASLEQRIRENDPTLTHINLNHATIGVDGAASLSASLRGSKNTHVQTLELHSNDIRAEGAYAIAALLSTAEEEDDGDLIPIVELNLGSNDIGDEGALWIGSALADNTTLRTLNLWRNKIGPLGVEAIATALGANAAAVAAAGGRRNTTLRQLSLGWNDIGDQGAMTMAKVLLGSNNSSLTELSLKKNGIGVEGVMALARSLCRNSSLLVLDLSYNNMGDEGGHAIAAALLNFNHTITMIEMEYAGVMSGDIMNRITELLKLNTEMGPLEAAAAKKKIAPLEGVPTLVSSVLPSRVDDVDDHLGRTTSLNFGLSSSVSGHLHESVADGRGRHSPKEETSDIRVLHDDEYRKAVDEGRDIMRRVIDSSNATFPTPIPFAYLDYCTDEFSDARKLGEGRYSHVYLGKDKELRRKFAVKRLRIQLHADGTNDTVVVAKKAFERELATLRHFRHPNIARLYAYFLSPNLNGDQCLVFEFAANGALQDFLKHGKMREKLHWTTRINIALDVAKALEYLHKGKAGQVCFHRDVKSANTCLKRDFTALLIDCGVSKMIPIDESNMTMTVMDNTCGDGVRGTPGYICPMYARKMRCFTSACDVFSLGIVFAELFTGNLQYSCVDDDDIDLFDRYSYDGLEKRDLREDADRSAGEWDDRARHDFASISVECISINPGMRPKIQDIVQRLKKMASQARPWAPGDSNRITVLTSAPLVWRDSEDVLHPISESPNFALERDLLVHCINEARRDVEVTFDVATDDRLQAAVTKRCGCLQFSGHGHPNALVFEDGYGGAYFIGEDQLYDRVHIEPFKFVFVSACHSGLLGRALVKAGVPHVVCCEYDTELRDDVAMKFTHTFYFALAEGYTIKTAFDKGLLAIGRQFDECEVEKFVLLPENGDHNLPLFDAEILEWYDECHSPNVIPAPPDVFLGREIDSYILLQQVLARRFVTLKGDEGVGCSSLASAVCHYINDRKTSLLTIEAIYFERRGPRDQRDALGCFIMPLYEQLVAEGKASKVEEGASLCDVFSAIFEALVGSRALIVFDGVCSDDTAVADFVKLLFENTIKVKVLLTGSEQLGISSTHVEEHVVLLGPLDFVSTLMLFVKTRSHSDSLPPRGDLQRIMFRSSEPPDVDRNLGERSKSLYEKLGGGIPANTIRLAKVMTEEEYETLCVALEED